MATMETTVDSYRFLDFPTRTLVSAWIAREPEREIPWVPLSAPLSDCRIAVVSTAAVAMRGDRPFDQEGERRDPWWGDPSYRVIDREVTAADVAIYHLHIDTSYGARDLDCVMPLGLLCELESGGEIGSSAPSHYSYMGYILDPRELLEQSVPAIVRRMRSEEVDVALLVPV